MNNTENRRIPFGMTVTKEMLDELDKKRGMIPRTRFIEHLLKQALEGKCSCCPKDTGNSDNGKD